MIWKSFACRPLSFHSRVLHLSRDTFLRRFVSSVENTRGHGLPVVGCPGLNGKPMAALTKAYKLTTTENAKAFFNHAEKSLYVTD